MELIIGTRKWSSWSLRPWLALKRIGAPFSETVITLREIGVTEEIARHSPSGRVPVLRDGDLTVWDSLAICEYLADRFPDAKLWPKDPERRAIGRAATAEMHSGFPSLRGECPMDLGLHTVIDLAEATRDDIRRVVGLWADLRGRFGADGPFLLGDWSIADAFYTPVATRFRSYGIKPSDFGDTGAAGGYIEALLRTPEFLEWEELALAEG
ncbi:MAG TPA: glutathione S-transferase family protein [Caulobacteraceae bacterium]|nr:glutathione S-transferase family protein [Caulobacteraceae bacterium]